MTIGYAILTYEQEEKNILKIFSDKQITSVVIEQNGSTEKLKNLIDQMNQGDQLVISKAENVCNNSRELILFVGKLNKKGLNLYSLNDEWLDTRQPVCKKLLLDLFDFEMKLMQTRRKGNLSIPFGRRPGRQIGTIDWEKALKAYEYYKSKEYRAKQICKLVGISKSTLYKYLRCVEERKKKSDIII